ncbi:Lar family restriction alleviation protein [Aurantivibrio plasticivorans]
MGTKIAACPFCNSHRIHVAHCLLSYSVSCETCKCRGPHKRELSNAIEEWNQISNKVHHATIMEEPILQSHLVNLEHAVRNLTGALRHEALNPTTHQSPVAVHNH